MKPFVYLFILLLGHFISFSQTPQTNGIYIFDGENSNWYENEFFVRFFEEDSLIFGKLMSPSVTNPDSMGKFLNGLTYIKRPYQRSDDKISVQEELNYDSKFIEYNILLTSDTTLWLKSSEKIGFVSDLPNRFKFINVDYLDQNTMFVDTCTYKVISNMPYPKTQMRYLNDDVTKVIRQIEDAEDFDECFTSIKLIVLEDGTCTNWGIHRSGCWEIAEDIHEEFKKSSPWKAGTHLGRRVKCRFMIPYKFKM